MVAGRKKPTFNLKVVVQETGIKPDTIRAWERRYDLPQPARTAGGHRLYSQHDIDTLKWLVERQHEGLSISRAVDLWNTILEEGNKPLEELPLPAGIAAEKVALSAATGDVIAEFRQRWVGACMNFDEQQADAIIAQALARYPVEVVCTEVLQRGMAEIGERWYQNDASVQQEHFASELAVRRVETLIAATPAPTRPGRILAACPPEENHTFGLLITTLLLRRQGWDVLFLGANVPAARLAETIQVTRPRLVVMAVQQLVTAARLLEIAQVTRAEGVMLGFGGNVFSRLPTLAEYIPGHYLGDEIAAIPDKVDELMLNPVAVTEYESASSFHEETLRDYQEKQPYIEADVWQTLEPTGIAPRHLEQANAALAENIAAALALGDIGLIQADINWVDGLLAHYGLNSHTLQRYLDAYLIGAERHLGQAGELIIGALDRLRAQA